MSRMVNYHFTEYSIEKTERAFFDSFCALIPVKPIRFIETDNRFFKTIQLEVIDTVPNPSGYKIGETIECAAHDLIPIDKIAQPNSRINKTIFTNFKWID